MNKKIFAIKRTKTGLGFFTLEVISRGSRIIQYTGIALTNKEVEKHRGRYLFRVNSRRTIDGSSRSNAARYVNHSCRPNAEAQIIRNEIWIIAKRKIRELEEVTIDYGKEYFNDYIKPKGCRCEKCLSGLRRMR